MTLNEERNLEQCLESVVNHIDEIIIVDCFSSDKTLEIAKKYTNKIYQNKWINYARQYQWAIDNTDITNDWVLRLDADERWTKKGFTELANIIESGKYDGVYVKMQIYFMSKWIRFGGFYPNLFLRVYKRSKGTIEDRWMDEHIQVQGETFISKIDVIEANYDRQQNITLWTTKHNNYSTREAIEFLIHKHNLKQMDSVAKFFGNTTERKRWLKEKFYFRFPLFIRPFLYFSYRYILKLGFLDGKKGVIFHFLHAFWYRFLVDVKVYQIESIAKQEKKPIPLVIKEHYGIDI